MKAKHFLTDYDCKYYVYVISDVLLNKWKTMYLFMIFGFSKNIFLYYVNFIHENNNVLFLLLKNINILSLGNY